MFLLLWKLGSVKDKTVHARRSASSTQVDTRAKALAKLHLDPDIKYLRRNREWETIEKRMAALTSQKLPPCEDC
jgi:hypothetical protein